MTRQTLLDQFQQSLEMTEASVADVADERWAEQPRGLANHPAWTVGHLCVALGFLIGILGGESPVPGDWGAKHGTGTQPMGERDHYAAGDELMGMLRMCHARVEALVRGADEATFAALPPESIRAFTPTVGHITAYMLLSHGAAHNAQLGQWRRLAGFEPIS